MRIYLTYDTTGQLRGYARNDREWPQGYDIMSESPTHPLAIANRQAHLEAMGEEFGGFIAFDCECAYDEECRCAREQRFNYYVENGQFVAKPSLTIKINGNLLSPTSSDAPLALTPSASAVLRLEAAVPNGTSITLKRSGARLALTDPVLVFTNGIATCDIVAPAQGLQGVLSGVSRMIRPLQVHILGWAT